MLGNHQGTQSLLWQPWDCPPQSNFSFSPPPMLHCVSAEAVVRVLGYCSLGFSQPILPSLCLSIGVRPASGLEAFLHTRAPFPFILLRCFSQEFSCMSNSVLVSASWKAQTNSFVLKNLNRGQIKHTTEGGCQD